MVTLRPYAGAADLRRMQSLVADPRLSGFTTPGDLAWFMREHPHHLLARYVQLAESGDVLLGWMWFFERGWFEIVVSPDGDASLYAVLFDAALATARDAVRAGDVIDSVYTYIDPREGASIGIAEQRGFVPDGKALLVNRTDLAELDEPALPSGYRFDHVGTDDDVHGRVAAQRAAFAPSMFTADRYRRVRCSWPYRADLDRVVRDPRGAIVAFCTGWIDEQSGRGLLEPVGTVPAQQRRGLGHAVCLDAMQSLRAAGARTAQVLCDRGSAGCRTYRGLGFTEVGSIELWRRSAQGVSLGAAPARRDRP